ncbi:VOC family protein [Pyrinomonas methylaliphatogenes]|uniref:VOC domain-containing protein n=1 Tax=Pyrinomonas methylaliphatogenes TaxID=454194 RepID=A0A0B6WX61_9BACT|nr:VOC family protein [Pyrinomonas methylaliphatogenes]CDM65878.1 hypothetical protein PYK22_01886 [Pyrinomonas methylaliphatogenes]
MYDKALLVQRSIRQQAVAGITEAEYATTINVLQRLVANLEHNETVYSASVSSEQLKNQDQISVRQIREGFHTVTPYLLVEGADRLIEFLSTAFDAEILDRKFRPDGTVMHAELRIGDSMVMLGEASSEFRPMSASIYLYVPDWDRVYQQALAAGGESVFAIRNLPSGERYGGVKDPCGNIWWIATHIEDVSPEEEERRWREFFRL